MFFIPYKSLVCNKMQFQTYLKIMEMHKNWIKREAPLRIYSEVRTDSLKFSFTNTPKILHDLYMWNLEINCSSPLDSLSLFTLML